LAESPGAQARFFEGVCQLLQALCGQSPPGVVFFDDIQWADEASLDLLTYLVRRLRGRRVFVLVTWRDEDIPQEHRLRHLLAEAQRNGLGSAITLSRLDAGAVQELVGSVAGGRVAELEALSQRLFQETEGLPFFIAEYLAAMPESAAGEAGDWGMPQGVRDILRSRLETLDEAGRQLLQTAAVIGRSFDFDALQDASGRSDEETAATLEVLLARGLIREAQPAQGEAGGEMLRGLEYDFSHDKMRSLVYTETSQARRRLLHQRVADVLLRHTHGRKELRLIAGLVAYHYRQAGRAKEAAEYSRLAGEHARSLFANAEALAHFQIALALGHPDFIGLEEAIGDLYTLQGNYRAALTCFASAAGHESASSQDAARLRHKMGDVYHRQGEWEQAESCYQIAAESMSGSDLSRLYADWSRTLRRAGQPEQALKMARQSLELAEKAADEHALAQAHNILGMLLRMPPGPQAGAATREDLAEAIAHLEASLALAEKLPDPGARIAALNNLSLAYADHGELERALERAHAALELCSRLGDRHREAALHSNLADLYHAAGMETPSMSHQKAAAVIFSEIGASELDRPRPEIWKLTEW
jgi:predicted ATPase